MEKAAYVQKLLANARVTSAIAMFNQQSLEIRAQKGQAMLDARRAINEAVASQQQGKTTGEELQRVMAAYRANLPPDGTWIDRDGWMLRQ